MNRLPDKLSDLLPDFNDWRENQKEVVEDIVDHLDGDEPHQTVLVNAPTGAGKTIIGAATARALNGKALYLAHTIVLQKQQLHTLPGAVTATGRRNHECLLATKRAQELPSQREFYTFPEFTAEDASDVDWCSSCPFASPTGCSYYQQWFNATDAADAVLNYAYITRVSRAPMIRVADGFGNDGPELNLLQNPFINRSLMVCDEGHNLESALIDVDKITVRHDNFARINAPVPESDDIQVWKEWAINLYPSLLSMHQEMKQRALDTGSISIRREAKRLASMLSQLETISNFGKEDDGVIYIGQGADETRLQPIWVWNRAQSLLFRHSHKQIIMSATLGDNALAARLLGLQSWQSVDIPSTFPIENRPIAYWPVSRMTYDTPEAQKALQGLALSYLARLFPDKPGVVHCNSYTLGRFLSDVVRANDSETASRIVMHDSKSREAVHAEFERDPQNKILITPAATTGVDWDFVHWQMLPKIPYPDLSDPITKLRKDYVDENGEALGSTVYLQEAIKTLVQACGRNVRTPKSMGINIITDAGFWALYKHIAPSLFPTWFRDAVRWADIEPNLEEHLEMLRSEQ